jgi:hypothetical protein
VSRGIAQLFLNLSIRRGCVVSITPRPPLPPGKTWYPLYRRLGGPGAENLAPPGFDPRTFQPVASRYTDYAIRLLLTELLLKNHYYLQSVTLFPLFYSIQFLLTVSYMP